VTLIASVHGRVLDRGVDHVVVGLGGFGVRVFCSPALAAGALDGDEILLFTHLYLREDAAALYGFTAKSELTVFENLIGVSGVGPKVGLALLSTLGVDRLSLSIGNGESSALTGVPGVGKKTAERIVLELKDKFRSGLPPSTEADGGGLDDVATALVALGYSPAEAEDAARKTPTEGSTEDRILAALRSIGQR
jgi:holliday junction DNA helicase RuvA